MRTSSEELERTRGEAASAPRVGRVISPFSLLALPPRSSGHCYSSLTINSSRINQERRWLFDERNSASFCHFLVRLGLRATVANKHQARMRGNVLSPRLLTYATQVHHGIVKLVHMYCICICYSFCGVCIPGKEVFGRVSPVDGVKRLMGKSVPERDRSSRAG